jgi:U1 small nuclear ribonucleoprotein
MAQRKMTPRGQMTSGANGPAIMMMPPHIRVTFMPDPPLKFIARIVTTRKHSWTGMSEYLTQFEKTTPTTTTGKQQQQEQQALSKRKEVTRKRKEESHQASLQPFIEDYRKAQKESGGEVDGMNCYNTLFVGRLAYEVTERKLLREMEQFGPIKDLKIIKDDKTGKSRGFAFCEYENEEDMKRAYRAADGMRIEGREIVVDVERGHTVPGWLPRRLGGGLGGTR